MYLKRKVCVHQMSCRTLNTDIWVLWNISKSATFISPRCWVMQRFLCCLLTACLLQACCVLAACLLHACLLFACYVLAVCLLCVLAACLLRAFCVPSACLLRSCCVLAACLHMCLLLHNVYLLCLLHYLNFPPKFGSTWGSPLYAYGSSSSSYLLQNMVEASCCLVSALTNRVCQELKKLHKN